MDIANDKVVSISYTLKDDAGTVLDSSDGREDLDYLHGHSNIVEGLEEALEGKSIGDSVSVSVPPEKGYGTRDDEAIFQVPKENMPDEELELGMQFAAQDKDGNNRILTLVEIGDEKVTLDANHPLAGETLHFDVTVNNIRDAQQVEIDHGHVHDPDHHHHE